MLTEMQAARATSAPPSNDERRQARILAKSVYRELREGGLDEREVMAIATELLGLVTDDLRARS